LMLMMCVGMGAWADEVTFTYSDYKGEGTTSTGSEYTMDDKTYVSIGDTKFYGNNSYNHFYAGGKITVTPKNGATITKIAITTSGTSYNGYQSSGKYTASAGSVAKNTTNGAIVEWTGSASSAFTLDHDKQIRWTSIVVTYTTSGGGSTPEPTKYNITIANDIANGSVTATPTSAAEKATVTLTATPASGYELVSWNVTNASTKDAIEVKDNKFTMPAANVNVSATFNKIQDKTIAEFIASEGGKCYLTGVVSNIATNNYGNFDLTDETGTIYVYGCLTPAGEKQKFNTLDVVAGDKIKVLAETYELYNEKHEAKNVIFVEEIAIEKAQYTVTIETPENGTLVVKDGENTVSSGDKIEEGKTLTIECTPTDAENYRYKNWQYKEDGNWVTMTTSMTRVVSQDLSIRANFELIPTYTVAWSVDGTIVKTEELKEDAEVTAPTVEPIDSKVFTGWVTTESVDADATPNYIIPSTTATEDVTYYAVFADEVSIGKQEWKKIEDKKEVTAGIYAIIAFDEGRYLPNATATSGAPATKEVEVKDGSITVKDDMKWNLSIVDGNYVFESVTYTNNYLWGAPTNEGIRITEKSAKSNAFNKWKLESTDDYGLVLMDAGSTGRYLSTYSDNDWRNYTSTSKTNRAANLYKLIGGYSYSDFTTSVSAPDHATSHTLTLVAQDAGTYYGTFSSDKVTFFPEDYIVSAVGVENSQLYQFDNEEVFDEDIVKINGEDVLGYYVPANTGILITSLESTVNYCTVEGVTPSNEVEAINMLRPATASMTGDYKFYKLAYGDYTNKKDLGFYYGAADGASFTCKAGTAYLAVPTASAVKSFALNGEATAIQSVNTTASSSTIYNLAGQRLSQLQKGINIVDGKKLFIK
ncbi:MAG: hypothetical protein KBT06_06630, partial [Prevotellaceae bacterium]|nr:hypothetical protein [Candidatus Colivivens equi]